MIFDGATNKFRIFLHSTQIIKQNLAFCFSVSNILRCSITKFRCINNDYCNANFHIQIKNKIMKWIRLWKWNDSIRRQRFYITYYLEELFGLIRVAFVHKTQIIFLLKSNFHSKKTKINERNHSLVSHMSFFSNQFAI